MVLVVIDTADRKLQASEAYGDWQTYLQTFVESNRGALPVHQVTPDRVRALLPQWPRNARNGTLFLNAQGQGLLHRGLVLEPQTYVIGKGFAQGGSMVPESANYGLEAFKRK